MKLINLPFIAVISVDNRACEARNTDDCVLAEIIRFIHTLIDIENRECVLHQAIRDVETESARVNFAVGCLDATNMKDLKHRELDFVVSDDFLQKNKSFHRMAKLIEKQTYGDGSLGERCELVAHRVMIGFSCDKYLELLYLPVKMKLF